MAKKYIWPHDIGNMSRWYLSIIKGVARGCSLDELIAIIGSDPDKKPRQDRNQVRRSLYNLSKQGLVEKRGAYEKTRYYITETGVDRLEKLSFRGKPQPLKSWDKKWRIVIFDIPEDNRAARDQIRRLLKELNFAMLQQSVWIHPLPLLKEFKAIQQAYGLEKHLQLIETSSYQPSKEIKRIFKLANPK